MVHDFDENDEEKLKKPEADDKKDAFDLTDEEFNEVLETGDMSRFTADEPEPDPSSDAEPSPDQPPSPKSDPNRTPGEVFTLTHNGVQHNLDRGKIVELAQKGFDYDVKVGPHGRIVQLLDSDPQAQRILNGYFMQKLGLAPTAPPPPASAPAPTAPVHPSITDPNQPPRVDLSRVRFKKISEFNTEDEWLADSLNAALAEVIPQIQRASAPPPAPPSAPTPSPQQGPSSPVQAVVQAISGYDPQSAAQIIPLLDQYADSNLSAREYRQATGSLPNFFAFYDRVKADVLSGKFKPTTPGSPAPPPSPSPTDIGRKGKRFNLKPGGGTPPGNSEEKKTVNIWDIPRDKFDQLVASRLR